ncbi:MAG: phenylalanine--tRNA ligase subunit beta [Saprospiraceae bacterium]
MKISLNWLRQYIDTHDLSPEKIGEILTSTGLEVEGIEEVERVPGGLRGLVIGQVLTCVKHPNADKLSLTTVDVGQDVPLSIVCGAPNVAAGQKVVVAIEGTTLYPTTGDSFTIKKGKIRGEASEGMICAEDEIGLGHSHAGIIVLPETATVGQAARDYYGLQADFVYEIGLTPNRSDATNHLGVAYDLAAALQINHGSDVHVQPPVVDAFHVDNHQLPIAVEVRNSDACPRYSGVSITGIQVAESPDWLKERLLAVGVRPINNVVDATNFVLHELGQPLHAFDIDEISGGRIIVDTLPAATPFLALDETERKLHAEDLMICDGDNKGMCIGGVFGGLHSGVKDTTTRVFLESAHFHPEWIRRTSMRHNLRTDAARIFEKGSDPNNTVYALKRAALLIQELAGGTISSEVVDIYPTPHEPAHIQVRYQRINELIGVAIAPEQVHRILVAMGMRITAVNDVDFTVEVPTNKADVLREVDVIEEILRIYGFNNVPIPSRVATSMVIAPDPNPTQVRNNIANMLAAQGFHEMMALSLSESRYYKNADWVPADHLVYINNTSNVHLDIMRPDMVFSGLEAVLHNQNRQESDLRFFEFGRTYQRNGEKFEEINRLSLFMTGRRVAENWIVKDDRPVNFHTLKPQVDNILNRLGVQGYQQEELHHHQSFAYATRYFRGNKELVCFGRLQSNLTKGMDIKGEVFYANFHWDNIFSALPKKRVQFKELNKYPVMRRDLALVVDSSVKFSDIATIAGKAAKKLLRESNLFDVYVNDDQLGANKKSYAVSFIFEDSSRTMNVGEIDKIMQQIIQQCETQLNALIRR